MFGSAARTGLASLLLLAASAPASAQEVKLTASDGAVEDFFGYSVSVSGDVALVGAVGIDDDSGTNRGSAYVYRWNGSKWMQEAKLTASDGAEGDNFGWSVSVTGDVALVGAWLDDDFNGRASGSAYVYDFTPGVSAEAPPAFVLAEVYPNPALSRVKVAFEVGAASHVRIALFDVLGRRVRSVHEGPVSAGAHATVIETAGLPAGVYVLRVEAAGAVESRRLTVVE